MDDRKSEFSRRQDGAKQRKDFTRYVPLGSNKAFNGGEFLSLPTMHIRRISGSLDWRRMSIHYDDVIVVIEGKNLRSIANKLEGVTLACIIEDGMQEGIGEDTEAVESLTLVPVEGQR